MNDNTKIIAAILVVGIVCLAGGFLAGSNGNSTGDQKTVLKLEGSTTLAPLMEKYAEIYEGYSNIRIEIVSNGSQNGVDAANNGTADIGMSSRNVGHSSHAGLVETKIGVDTVVLIVGSGAGVTSLSKAQVEGIYSGTYTNWNQVGGNNLAILPIDREHGSGTRDYFESSFSVPETRTFPALDQTGTVIEYISTNGGAIGYVSLGSVTGTVTVLSLDMGNNGTVVSPITNLSAYTLKRDLVLLTKPDTTGQIEIFIGWILSPEGQKILEQEGYLPLSAGT